MDGASKLKPQARCNHTTQGCSDVKIDYDLSADEYVSLGHLTRAAVCPLLGLADLLVGLGRDVGYTCNEVR